MSYIEQDVYDKEQYLTIYELKIKWKQEGKVWNLQ